MERNAEKMLDMVAAHMLVDDINKGVLSRMVYKYRSISQVLRFLDDRKLYFARPSEFNDPFEGKYFLADTSEGAKKREEIENKRIAEMGIFCVGTDPANLIMWSHYCDFHKGATIEFDMMQDIAFFGGAVPVCYHKGYPCFHNKDSVLMQSIQHKFDEWSHEKEVRIIKQHSGLREISPQAVASIILGAKTSDEDMAAIIKRAREKGWNHLKWKKCELNPTDYKLDIVELNAPFGQ